MTLISRSLASPIGQIKLHGPEAFGHAQGGAADGRALDRWCWMCAGVPTEKLTGSWSNSRAIMGHAGAPITWRSEGDLHLVNHAVRHGIPNDQPLCEGDVLRIDVTLIVEGWMAMRGGWIDWAKSLQVRALMEAT